MQESEWKRFRQLHVVALNRFCEKVLQEISQITADATKSPHERYLQIFKVLRERDRVVADAFDDLRRSTALMQLAIIYAQGLINDDELRDFTQETRDAVLSMSRPRTSSP